MNILLTHRRMAILLTLAFFSIVGAIVLFFSLERTYQAETSYWPSLTMIYESDGPVHNGTTIRETRRLEYNSVTDWTETVIESDPIESIAFGTETTVGSYTRRNGNQFITYDSMTDYSSVKEIADSIVVPNQFLKPLLIFGEGADLESDTPTTSTGKTLSEVETTTRVCYQSDCASNVAGLEFDSGYGDQWTVLNDARWGIPLRVGDNFIVSELTLDVSKN